MCFISNKCVIKFVFIMLFHGFGNCKVKGEVVSQVFV